MLIIQDLVDQATVSQLRSWLAEAIFVDGAATAGADARMVKRNEQVGDDPKLGQMQDLVVARLWDHDLFVRAAMPKVIRPPLFSRYSPGMSYGRHVDNAVMAGVRVDLSLTLFLSDPSEYDAGELVVETSVDDQRVKLPAGWAVLYSTSALHQVTPVTRGRRLAAVTWVRSLVRDPAAREILSDLETVQIQLAEKLGKTAETDLVAKTHENLLRRWIDD